MTTVSFALTPHGLEQFKQLHHTAVETITAQFYTAHGAEYARFGERGRKACREDIEFHLNFLRPVLELGDLQPYTDYLRWFDEVLTARNVPTDHVTETLHWLGDFFWIASVALMAHASRRPSQRRRPSHNKCWCRPLRQPLRNGQSRIVLKPHCSPATAGRPSRLSAT
jgi:hypothetical protein